MAKLLREEFEHYRYTSLKLMESLNEETYEVLNDLLEERQMVINNINNENYSQDEFAELCSEFEILQLESKLTSMMNDKRKRIKKMIDKFAEGKNANTSYKSRFNVDSIYFNKKI